MESQLIWSDTMKSKTDPFHEIYLQITITINWKFYPYHAMILLVHANTCMKKANQKRIYDEILKWWMWIWIVMIWTTPIFLIYTGFFRWLFLGSLVNDYLNGCVEFTSVDTDPIDVPIWIIYIYSFLFTY